jgi:hypothetical protein
MTGPRLAPGQQGKQLQLVLRLQLGVVNMGLHGKQQHSAVRNCYLLVCWLGLVEQPVYDMAHA